MYPVGNAHNMNAPRKGNGADFDWGRPYRMYHGDEIPGFPQHPHRGFETLTLVQEGTCDHTDSLGQAGRYGGDGHAGDLQWMTAGAGCVHGENFPLRHSDKPNTLRLFQIWLNLPAKAKFAQPTYRMSWAEEMRFVAGEGGAECEVAAGSLNGVSPSTPPPPDSWAADPNNDVGVFYITVPPGGSFTLPPAVHGGAINRTAYMCEGPQDGKTVTVDGTPIPRGRAEMTLDARLPCTFSSSAPAGSEVAHFLILQGRPLDEPVVQRGPFVMNTAAEIQEANADYRRTQFGGWPWQEDAVVFPRDQDRFADIMEDGKLIRHTPAPAAKTELR